MLKEHQFRYPLFGWLLILNFFIVVVAKYQLGRVQELLWLSHVALIMAGIGLVSGKRLLVSTALTCIFLPHLLWLFDFLWFLLFGVNPIGITDYLKNSNIWIWVGTLHHLYLLPLLAALVLYHGRFPRHTFLVSISIYCYLTLLSRLLLHPVFNVNYAFRFFPGFNAPLLDWLNQLPVSLYLITINLLVITFFLLPTSAFLKVACHAIDERRGILSYNSPAG